LAPRSKSAFPNGKFSQTLSKNTNFCTNFCENENFCKLFLQKVKKLFVKFLQKYKKVAIKRKLLNDVPQIIWPQNPYRNPKIFFVDPNSNLNKKHSNPQHGFGLNLCGAAS
jgi:hypothetical protein